MLISVGALWRHKVFQTPRRLTVFSSTFPLRVKLSIQHGTLKGGYQTCIIKLGAISTIAYPHKEKRFIGENIDLYLVYLSPQ
jgi:hypothetical protein